MKRLLTGALALLLPIAASATTFNPIQLLNPAGSVAGQAIVSTGPTTVAAWGGIGLNGINAIAANTVLANATGSSASPTAFAMPSCSTSTSALNWTSGTGFTCGGSGLAPLASPTFTGTVTAPTFSGAFTGGAGSFSTLSASSTVSGTGFSNYFASPPCFGCTASAAVHATTINASSTITPSSTAGIVGTTTNDNANAGSIGEYLAATNSSVSLTTGTAANIVSESLTAGDWDVECTVQYNPAGSTTVSLLEGGVSPTSATLPGALNLYFGATAWTTGTTQILTTPITRESLASTTTVYCVALANFGVSTMTANAQIRARRVR